MSRVVVIGGSGHVGAYLLPALVERGHNVINVSRGQAKRKISQGLTKPHDPMLV